MKWSSHRRISLYAVALAIGLACSVLGIVTAAPAGAATPAATSHESIPAPTPGYVPAKGHYYRIKNFVSGLCIRVTGRVSKTKARDVTCSSAHAEQWKIKKEITVDGLFYVWLKNRASGLCLGQSGANGGYLTGNVCETARSRTTQQWRGLSDTATDGYHEWVSRQHGKCIGLKDGSVAVNARIVLASCADHTTQLWGFVAP
jgi:Ricin-type beta-trefoil lectin domain